jgi:xanthine dehydrogenase YagS FAD-binding subunit
MQAFEYAEPKTLKEALGLLSSRWGETEVLAGGTDLLSLMKNYVATPKRVVNLKSIAELRGITENPEGLRIGALTTVQELLEDQRLARFPALTAAAQGITSPQIRNMGTVGGDLCQRPRCWYFRNGFGLLARDARGRALVPEGDNRYHAILGNEGPAYFVSASSFGPPLIALGARVRIAGPKGTREIPVAEFFVIPKNESEREIALQPNEILTEVILPTAARELDNATYEVRQREFLDWPLATASVALELREGRIRRASIVLGHVAPIPWPVHTATSLLEGKALTENLAAEAGEQAVAAAKPLSKNRYKVQLARVAVKRALLAAAQGGA